MEVESRLNKSGHMNKIDSVVIADERDLNSEGMLLAKKHNVTLAPFFIVEDSQGSVKIYTVYFKFLKEILDTKSTEAEEISEIMDNNPDLDYI